MCGRFAQYQGLADYLAELNAEQDVISGYDNVPIARYNVAPSTKVYMLHGEARGIRLRAVRWGWAPHWAKANMPPVINARVETVASGKFFRAIWPHRALVMADGWYEWVKPEAEQQKQPYYIRLKSAAPMFFAALGQFPMGDGEEREGDGVVIITQASAGEMLSIHDRQPVVLPPEAARRWIDLELSAGQAEELVQTQGQRAAALTWHPVGRAVGNVKNEGPQLLEPLPS